MIMASSERFTMPRRCKALTTRETVSRVVCRSSARVFRTGGGAILQSLGAARRSSSA